MGSMMRRLRRANTWHAKPFVAQDFETSSGFGYGKTQMTTDLHDPEYVFVGDSGDFLPGQLSAFLEAQHAHVLRESRDFMATLRRGWPNGGVVASIGGDNPHGRTDR